MKAALRREWDFAGVPVHVVAARLGGDPKTVLSV